MFKKKTFILSRVLVGMILGFGFAGISYWQQNKNNPEFIEKIEELKAKYFYSTDNNDFYDTETRLQIADSFMKIFNPPILEFDASLADINAGENNIIFTYYFANIHDNHNNLEYYLNKQKAKFCNNKTDLERLQHLENYQFNYYNRTKLEFSVKLTYSDCQNANKI